MKLSGITVRFGKQVILHPLDWTIHDGESWAVLGTNACGKSSLARIMSRDITPDAGTIEDPPSRIAVLSLESQQSLYERELYRDDTDFMDHLDEGTPVYDLLSEITADPAQINRVTQQLHLESLLKRGYRALSSGEGRRVLLARALLQQPDCLVLDEPFEGLDATSRKELHDIINRLIADRHSVILLVNQQADISDGFEQLALMHQGRFLYQGERVDDINAQWQHLLSLHERAPELPARQSDFQLDNWPADEPLVELEDGFVQYDETYQFKGLNWRLGPGQHTQIAGPNGCGKSTLLGLVSGDHPQCYRNRIKVFSYQRGQGESIWQIKKHLGLVSGNLHRDYRVPGNVLTVVASGLTDSIGIYQNVGDSETNLARHWLQLIGLDGKGNEPFRQLSMGEQRLVLIARALIKQPPLLILDEPTQGLDDFNRFYVLSIVGKIIAGGPTTLLFVSHRQDETLDCITQRLEFSPSDAPDVLFQVNQTHR